MTTLPFSAHLGYLFTDFPLERRFAAARAAGFEAVEHPDPTALPAPRLAAILRDEGLRLVQITSGTGSPGEKGLAALPGREAEFRDGFARALDYAEAVGCPYVHPMAGIGGNARTWRGNLDAALRLAEGRAPSVIVEAISETAVPGYALSDPEVLLAAAADCDGRLSVLIDTYHARACGHDAVTLLERAAPWLGHVHVADFPGRGEPGSGDTDFAAVFATLARAGYASAIGFEYVPTGPGHLSWLDHWREMRTNMLSRELRS